MRRVAATLLATLGWLAGPVNLGAWPSSDTAPLGAITGAYAGVTSSPEPAYTRGQLSRWMMREGSGTSVADDVGGRALTLLGATWEDPIVGTGKALVFDGIDDAGYANAIPLEGATSASVCLWMKPSNALTNARFMVQLLTSAGAARIAVRQMSDGAVQVRFRGADVDPDGAVATLAAPANTLVTGEVRHICATFGAGGVRLYAQGAQVASATWFGSFGSSTSDGSSIGASYVKGVVVSPWTGSMGPVTWWGRELSAGDVAALYRVGR